MASYMRSCLMKPVLGSTCGRPSRTSARAESTVKGVCGREIISGVEVEESGEDDGDF